MNNVKPVKFIDLPQSSALSADDLVLVHDIYADKAKKATVETLAQYVGQTVSPANALETVKVNGQALAVVDRAVDVDLSGKVDKVSGKGLSANDFSNFYREKLESISENAAANVIEAVKVNGARLHVSANDKSVNINLTGKVDKEDGKGLSANDYSDAEKAKLAGVEAFARANQIECITLNGEPLAVENKTVNISLTAGGAAAGELNKLNGLRVNGELLTPDAAKIVDIDLAAKVDKADGMGLSANDYTSAEKAKLAGIAAGAQVNFLESVKVNGAALNISGKAVNIDLSGKVDKEEGKGLSSADYTAAEKTKLAGVEARAQVNALESVKVDGLALTVNNKAVNIDLSGKADKEPGKGLSTNDYTDAHKAKLAGIAAEAQVNLLESVKVNGAALSISGKAVNIDLSGKVDKESGKGLSSNDYTAAEKAKLAGVEAHADKTVFATDAEAEAGARTDVAVTPKQLKDNAVGYTPPALSMLIMPCALTGAQAIGWTPQGGQVTKALNAALYRRIVDEYAAGEDTTDSVVVSNVGGADVTRDITCRISASSGLKIVDAANRAAVDSLYAETGSAFYIILDQARELFYLPRFTDGISFAAGIGDLGLYGKDQIVNIAGQNTPTGSPGYAYPQCCPGSNSVVSGAFYSTAISNGRSFRPMDSTSLAQVDIFFDASRVVNTGDRVQGRNVKVFVYFRTGDTVVNEDLIDVGNMLAALDLKANADLSNTPFEGIADYVVEYYYAADGSENYVKWDSGRLEQWGYTTSTGAPVTVTFPVPFMDGNYSIARNTPATGTSSTYNRLVTCFNMTATSMQYHSSFAPDSYYVVGRWK